MRNRALLMLASVVLLAQLLLACVIVPAVTPTPAPTPTSTLTPTPTPTPTPTSTPPPAMPTIATVAGSAIPLGDGGLAAAAQLSAPFALACDAGNVYIADTNNNRIRRVDIATGAITTFAGGGTASPGDGGPATAAQLNLPAGVLLDSANLYISDRANNRIRRVDLATGTITTLAGTGTAGFGGDGGPATAAQLNGPYGLALGSGSLYIADMNNHRVRRIDSATGTINTVACTGTAGFGGDGGPATAAQLNAPIALAFGSGSLYIADRLNQRVRRVDLATGTITTFAGTGTAGFAGDGGPATAAQLNNPRGVAFDSGSLYIGDSSNSRVRRVDLATGTVTTLAGTGAQGSTGDGGPASAAQLNNPFGLAIGPGSLYIAEYSGSRVRRVDLVTGTITRFAGGGDIPLGDGGPATAAQLNAPQQLAVDSRSLYIADANNNRVRRVDLATGTISTFAGTGTSGFSGDGGPATAAQLNFTDGLALGSGNIYIGDRNNYRIRRVDLATGIITTAVGTGVRGYSGDGGPAAAAQIGRPLGLALDSANLCIADYDNARIRKVDLTTGIITTVAGIGVSGFSGDGGPATAAQLYGPNAVALDSANLYISDALNNRVRRVSLR